MKKGVNINRLKPFKSRAVPNSSTTSQQHRHTCALPELGCGHTTPKVTSMLTFVYVLPVTLHFHTVNVNASKYMT